MRDFKVVAETAGVVIGVLVAVCHVTAQESIWGSFDESRINYPAGTLNGDAHFTLRSIIAANGGTVAPGTSTLTAEYLRDKDVFYTSLLNEFTGALSGQEQSALQDWVANGGTLIVTADYNFPSFVYGSFTDVYGVTDYTDLVHQGLGNPVTAHPITDDLGSYRYAAEVTFTYGADALLLGDNGFGDDFMVVLEPATGFPYDGRMLVFGDHNLFADGFILEADNYQLASNMAAWAHSDPNTCLAYSNSGMIGAQPTTFSVDGALPGQKVVIVWGRNPDQVSLDEYPAAGRLWCAEVEIAGVSPSRIIGNPKIADVNGHAEWTKTIPLGQVGQTILTQALGSDTCPDPCDSRVISDTVL